LPVISIAPVTEWMEQERARAEHELSKQRYLERKEKEALAQAQAQALAQAQLVQPAGVPRHQEHMKKQGDSRVVGKYVIKKKDK
jgi:hypothetical protein